MTDTHEGIELNMVLLPKQHTFAISGRDRYRAFIGGFGSSKSFALAAWFYIRMFKLHGEVLLCAAPTYPQLTASTLDALFAFWSMMGVQEGIDYVYKRGDREIIAKQTGSKMYIRSLDDDFKIQGMTLSGVGVDEIEGVTDKIWRTLKTRVRAPLKDPRSFHAIRLAGNPPAGDHWFLRDFFRKETRRPGHEYETSSSLENWFLDDETLHELEYNIYKPGTPMWRRYINGELDVTPEGLVYDEFDEKIHCVSLNDVPFNDIRRWIYSMDFGYLNATVHMVTVRDKWGRYWIIDEYYKTQDVIDNHAPAMVKRRIKPGVTYADHDRQEREEYARRGIYSLPAFKDILVGVNAMKTMLNPEQDGGPKLFVVKDRCPNFIREINSYMWPETDEGKPIKEEPVKVDDHVMDASRYGIASDMKSRGLIVRGRATSTSQKKQDMANIGVVEKKKTKKPRTAKERERAKRKKQRAQKSKRKLI